MTPFRRNDPLSARWVNIKNFTLNVVLSVELPQSSSLLCLVLKRVVKAARWLWFKPCFHTCHLKNTGTLNLCGNVFLSGDGSESVFILKRCVSDQICKRTPYDSSAVESDSGWIETYKSVNILAFRRLFLQCTVRGWGLNYLRTP